MRAKNRCISLSRSHLPEECMYWRQSMKSGSAIAISLALLASGPAISAEINDYPTSTRADYVFACMKANGETRDNLDRCSCSIDVIASLLTYDKYVEAETVASMDQQQGQIGTMFRSTTMAKSIIDDLHRAQAEAEIRCF
jgi:hypothetical protein